MATTYSYSVNTENKVLCYEIGGNPVSSSDLPRFFFGDVPRFTLTFPSGTFNAGDVLVASIDTDKNFIDTVAMSMVEHEVTAEEAASQVIVFDMQTRTQRFVDCANNKPFEVKVFFEVKRHFETETQVENESGETETVTTQTDILLCDTFAYAKATVSQYGDPLVILPSEYYYNKHQINEIADGMEQIKQDAIAAKDEAVDAKNAAEDARDAASDARDAAVAAKDGSESAATLSKSYAIGGTGTRTGENTDNSKYYKEQAQNASSSASASKGEARASAKLSESYAKGGTNTRTGENTDNAKYYKEGAEDAKGDAQASAASAEDAKIDAVNAKDTAVSAAQTAASETAESITEQFGEALDNVDEAVTSAQTAATNAANSQTAAAGSMQSSYVWAEGTDEEVAVLGGEHSAKGWAEEASHGGAWGSITGDISSQTDLQQEFASKADLVEGTVPSSQLPIGGSNTLGIIGIQPSQGLAASVSGLLYIVSANTAQITNRSVSGAPINGSNLNYAVTAALTDANHLTLTAEQQATAQEVLGVPAPIIGSTAPTTATVGKLMQQYLNSTTGKTYHCTAITNTGTEEEPVWEYTWTDDINEKGGTIGPLTMEAEAGNNFLIKLSSIWGIKSDFSAYLSYGRFTNSVSISNNANAGYWGLALGNNTAGYAVASGEMPNYGQIAAGNWGKQITGARFTGYGTSANNRRNIEELSWAGDHYITGGHQQGITVIPSATTSYNLAEGVQSHTPAEASVYVFPAVTDTTRTHRIRLILDFATVQTYAFEDSQGTALTPLFTPTISAGDVYEFDCEYSAAKSTWLIWPHKQGAVSDDYVMQSEVGAANGVAGLDANGKVPRAELPIAGSRAGEQGAVITNGYYGVRASGNGTLQTNKATDADISGRDGDYKPIVPNNLNYAVRAAFTDANKISLTDAQKASAQDTLGAYGTLHLDAAPTTSTVGAFGQRAIVDATGKAYTCTAVTVDETDPQNPVTTYTWQEDLPPATDSTLGAVRGDITAGTFISSGGIRLKGASNAGIDLRIGPGDGTQFGAIIPANLQYAVRSVLPNITEIPAATSAYTLVAQDATTNNHCYCYEHSPESAPTYTLPAVSGNAVKREIILTIRFSSSVLTYAFEDAQGNPLTPLPLAGTIADGSVVAFRCTWEALLGQWVIMPVMLGTYEEVTP